MCGIAGYFGDRRIDDDTIAECLRLMHHRGPDHAAARHFVNPSGKQVDLLHSRLNIIDLSERGNQPFQVGQRWLTYNGELYNFVELRDELRSRGEDFVTESDTEVLARALARDGAAALDRCEGMWAFGFYDAAAGSLLLARDRFGEKPLYLYRDESGLYFGSEVKLVRALLGRRLEVNVAHLQRYLVNGYRALYKTSDEFFEGVEELPAGTLLDVASDGIAQRRRYWHFETSIDDDMSLDEALAGVRERVIRSVELRLRADVPLAFCMSGGVDSNALIGVAKRELGYDVHGFTIVNSDARYEEQEMVELAVAELGLRHTPIAPRTDSFLERLRRLVRHHDAPVYTIAYYAHWLLMESIAGHGYRIAVSGTGADELLTGYYDHHLAYLRAVRTDPELHARSLAAWREHVQPIVRNPFLKDPDLFVRDRGLRDHLFLDAERFAAMLGKPFSESFTESHYSPHLLRNRMLNEMFHEVVPVTLHEEDLNAMSCSIENRSPFLDRSLFEFCQRIPTRHLIRDGRAKAVLRDAMRGVAPDAILMNRRKVGFNAPIAAFLAPGSTAVRERILADSPVFELVRRDAIADLLSRQDIPNSQSKFLFYFLCTKFFLEEHAA